MNTDEPHFRTDKNRNSSGEINTVTCAPNLPSKLNFSKAMVTEVEINNNTETIM
jgi:hypothetical protein